VVIGAVFGFVLALATALPLAWKWQLGMRRSAPWMAVFAAAAGAAAYAIGASAGLSGVVVAVVTWVLALTLAAAAVLYRYRDPQRAAPDRDDVVVSPADGEVVYVRTSAGGLLPTSTKKGRRYALTELTKTQLMDGDAVVVGIALSFLDVHVNRAPLAGHLSLLRRFPGRFGSLKDPAMVFENERATLVIERGDVQIGVVQIASRLVRRIVAFVAEGQELALGQRIGMIRFGSQVDVVLPLRDDVAVTVRPGDRVRAGELILAVLKAPAATDAESRAVAAARP